MPGSPPPNAAVAVMQRARFPRRRRALMPLRWYHGTFTLAGRRLRIPVARGRPPLWVRLDRDLPYPPDQVRSVTLVYDAGRLWVDVTAEVPVACYPAGQEPDPARIAGVDLGIIHPYAVAGPGRPGAAGVGAGDPRRAPHAPGRHQGPRAGRWPAARPSRGREGRGGGGTTGAASGWPRRGTGGGSARPSTRPPKPSSPGPLTGGSAPWPSATPAACSTSRPGGGITSAPATGASAT